MSRYVTHDRYTGAYRNEHPTQEGRQFRPPQGHGALLRSGVSGPLVVTAFASYPLCCLIVEMGVAVFEEWERDDNSRVCDL